MEIGHCGRCGGCKYLAGDTYGYLHGTWLDLEDSNVTAIWVVVQGGIYIDCLWLFRCICCCCANVDLVVSCCSRYL